VSGKPSAKRKLCSFRKIERSKRIYKNNSMVLPSSSDRGVPSTPWSNNLYAQYRPPTTTLPITHNDYSYTQHLTEDVLTHGSDDSFSVRSNNAESMVTYGHHRFDQMEVSEPDAPLHSHQRAWTPIRFTLLYICIMILIYALISPVAGSLMGIYSYNNMNPQHSPEKRSSPTYVVFFIWAGSWLCTLPTSIIGIVAFTRKQFVKSLHVWYISGISFSLLIHIAALITYAVLVLVDATAIPGSPSTSLAVVFILVMVIIALYTIAVSLTFMLMKRQSTVNYNQLTDS
jgi:hypothetical protein